MAPCTGSHRQPRTRRRLPELAFPVIARSEATPGTSPRRARQSRSQCPTGPRLLPPAFADVAMTAGSDDRSAAGSEHCESLVAAHGCAGLASNHKSPGGTHAPPVSVSITCSARELLSVLSSQRTGISEIHPVTTPLASHRHRHPTPAVQDHMLVARRIAGKTAVRPTSQNPARHCRAFRYLYPANRP